MISVLTTGQPPAGLRSEAVNDSTKLTGKHDDFCSFLRVLRERNDEPGFCRGQKPQRTDGSLLPVRHSGELYRSGAVLSAFGRRKSCPHQFSPTNSCGNPPSLLTATSILRNA